MKNVNGLEIVRVVTPKDSTEIIHVFGKKSATGKQMASVMVESTEIRISNGLMSKHRLISHIVAEETLLRELNLKVGDELPGRIVVLESTKPFYNGQDAKINPTTGEVCRNGGLAIYRQTRVVQDNTPDMLLALDKEVAEIPVSQIPED